MPFIPKSQLIISIIIAIDILLLFNIYEKKEIIFQSNPEALASKITKNSDSKVAGVFTTRRRYRTNTYVSVSPSPSPKPTATNTPTPTKKATPTPTKKPIIQTPTPTKTQQTSTNSNSPLLKQINDFRASQGKSPFSEESTTCSFASLRAGEIVSSFNHDGFRSRIDSKTLPYSGYSHVSENIAMNSDPNGVVPGWIDSSGHRENLLADDPYGCVRASGNYYAFETWKP